MFRPLLDVQMSFRVASAKGFLAFQKQWQAWDIWRRSGNMHFPWQVQYKRHVHQRCWFPGRGCILEHQIFSFGKMNLWDRCSTSYALASLFRGRHSTLDRRSGKNTKRICTRLSALQSSFHFWRKSRRIASFLMLPTSKIEEISQNCFRFDAVKFKNWGSLANLLLFWCCQTQKLRKPRGIASFSSLQIDR